MVDHNREADRLHSLVVRARGACERCGKPGEECAHIIRRRFLRTRWLPDNAWCLCHDCHTVVDQNAVQFAMLIARTIGEPRYDELYALSRDLASPKPDRKTVRAGLRAVLKETVA